MPIQTSQEKVSEARRWPAVDINWRYSIGTATLLKLYTMKPKPHNFQLLQHKHPFNGPFSGTTRVSWYQNGKTNLDFTEARDSEW